MERRQFRPQERRYGQKRSSGEAPVEITRVFMPRGRQVFGVVTQRLGGSRMRVICLDSKTRVCRIPGSLKRNLWVRESDIVVVEPWEYGGDEKGDIIYKYTRTQAEFLKKKGHLVKLEEFAGNEF